MEIKIFVQQTSNLHSHWFGLLGVKDRTLGRQNKRNFCYESLALTSIFGLCFMSVCLMKSNCYSLIYSSLVYWRCMVTTSLRRVIKTEKLVRMQFLAEIEGVGVKGKFLLHRADIY